MSTHINNDYLKLTQQLTIKPFSSVSLNTDNNIIIHIGVSGLLINLIYLVNKYYYLVGVFFWTATNTFWFPG